MASPVTGLSATPVPDSGFVTLAWTNPGTGETGIAIEIKLTRGSTWTRVYDSTVVSTRKVRPQLLTPCDFRVATRDGGGLSTWTTVTNITLQGVTARNYPVILESTIDGSMVFLGAGANLDNNVWNTVTNQITLQPPGQQDPRFFFTRQMTRNAQQFTFSMFNIEVLGNGTKVYGDDQFTTLENFQINRHLLLYRDNKVFERYIYIWGVTNAPKAGIHRTVTFIPNQATTPTVRYTT